MKKIMFNDKYGLTDAVLRGDKTMTRRIIPIDLYNQTDWKAVAEGDYEAVVDGEGDYHDIRCCGTYKKDEVVAIAQKYWDLRNDDAFYEALAKADPSFPLECIKGEKGCNNKMFVKADWMPHRIRITDVKVERLQDISDEDCLREGIVYDEPFPELADPNVYAFPVHGKKRSSTWWNPTPKIAFENLIRHMMGKKVWNENPWVFAYSFVLVK